MLLIWLMNYTHSKWMVILGSLWGVADVELSLEQGQRVEKGVCVCVQASEMHYT